MVNYEIFYKRNGVRLPQHLMLPFVPTIDKFQFPFQSVHHYVTYDSVLNGPESSEYFYREIDKKIFVEHIWDITGNKGNPRKIPVPLMPYAREFHNKNKRFRLAEKPTETVADMYTLVVVNYGLIGKAYRYTRSIYAEYFKWWNIQKTMWDKVGHIATTTTKNQFIFVDLPDKLLGLSKLNQHASRFSEKTVSSFGGGNGWFILELWKWMSEEYRNNSVLGELSAEQLHKVNLVFKDSGRYAVMNLGVINSWRYIKGAPVEDGVTQKVKITPLELQKRFLRFLMTLMSMRAISDTQVVDDENTETATDTPIATPVNTTTPTVNIDDDERSTGQIAQDMLDQLDDDISALDEINAKDDSDEEDNQTTQVKIIESSAVSGKAALHEFDVEVTPEDSIKAICDDLADSGALTASEYRRFLKMSENYKQIVAPNGKDTLAEFATVKPETLKIESSHEFTDIPTVVDKSMLKNSLVDFDEKYIKNILQKDIASMIVNAQKGGFVINKYEVERVENISGKFDIHTVRITPVEGLPSTLRFNIPVVDDEGVYMSGGVNYKMRKQRVDKPLRKTDTDRVSLTTYFGKTFVTRNDKKTNDYASWLRTQIMDKGMDESDNTITNLFPANVFDNEFDAPRGYSSVAMSFKQFKSGGYDFIFDRHSTEFDPVIASKYNKNGTVVVAVNDAGNHLVMDKNNTLYTVGVNGLEPKGSFESFIGVDTKDSPVDFAQVKIYGKDLPVGLVLSYMYGLDNLLEKLKITPRRVAAGQRLNLQDNEFSIAFSDETLIFSRDDQLSSMVFGGFKEFEKSIRQYSVNTFDKPNVYLNVFESQGVGVRYLREIQMFNDLFVDPISKDLLVQDNLPTTFPGMLIKATELLLTDKHPDSLDMEHMRIRGYERMAGAVYSEICQSVREHKTKSGKKHHQIDLNPRAVWRKISTDPSITTSSGINPIKNIKEKEAVTFNGVGGRTSRSMVRSTRGFHPNDTGVISESTVDNSDVGINTFLTADPQFDSLRGTSRKYDQTKIGVTPILSTSAQISVGSTSDDPKRVNFVGIQHEHGIACNGYTQGMVRTGYEQVVAQRTSDMFCYAAKKAGKIVSVKPEGILIEYEDGETRGIEIGRRFGSDSGLVFAHEVKTKFKEGDSFVKGDVLTYNEGFFEPDLLNPNNMVWKQGIMVNTVLWESSQTLEDASSISKNLASKLSTKTSKVKTVKVAFDQVIRNMVTVGLPVTHESILCVIEDAVTSNSNLFDEESLDTLRLLSSQTPTAKTNGVIERIEVFYHGDKEDMSDSLRLIANAGDKDLTARAKATGRKAFTGQVGEEMRLEGESLGFETMAIRFYITTNVIAGVGD